MLIMDKITRTGGKIYRCGIVEARSTQSNKMSSIGRDTHTHTHRKITISTHMDEYANTNTMEELKINSD